MVDAFHELAIIPNGEQIAMSDATSNSKDDTVKAAAVVGAGQMGNGIAHVLATSGHAVTMIDVSADALKRGVETIAKNLERQV